MRIAQIAPLSLPLPPAKYGGSERIIHALTEELVTRGHEVTLFASGDSKTSAKLVSVSPHSLSYYQKEQQKNKVFDIYRTNALSMLGVGMAYRMQSEFDIIHDHTSQNFPCSLVYSETSRIPVVVTLHGAFTQSTKKLFSFYNKPYYVTISQAQAKPAVNLHHAGTVYNGLPMEEYPFKAKSKGYLLYVGRVSVEKGVDKAIEVARLLDLPLIIAGSPDMFNYKQYVQEKILPNLTDKIRWIGEVDEQQRNSLMSNALCLLHPVVWPEPFGLTMIEAMACGCPVIGFSIGSIPEVIEHGKTGYVVRNVSEMAKAVTHISQINRQECREYALKRFTAQTMTDGYETIYRSILTKKRTETKHVQIIQEQPYHLTRAISLSSDIL